MQRQSKKRYASFLLILLLLFAIKTPANASTTYSCSASVDVSAVNGDYFTRVLTIPSSYFTSTPYAAGVWGDTDSLAAYGLNCDGYVSGGTAYISVYGFPDVSGCGKSFTLNYGFMDGNSEDAEQIVAQMTFSFICATHHGGSATCTKGAVCELCGAEYTEKAPHQFTAVPAKAATCSEEGYASHYTCSVCGAYGIGSGGSIEVCSWSDIAIAASGHTYQSAQDSECHFQKCAVCGDVSGKEVHQWVPGTVLKEATCAENGSQNMSCSVCGYETVITLDKKPHTEVWKYNGSEHWKICSTCGKEITAKSAHAFGNWSVSVQATTSTEEVEKRVCSECGYAETRAIPKVKEESSQPASRQQESYETSKEPVAIGVPERDEESEKEAKEESEVNQEQSSDDEWKTEAEQTKEKIQSELLESEKEREEAISSAAKAGDKPVPAKERKKTVKEETQPVSPVLYLLASAAILTTCVTAYVAVKTKKSSTGEETKEGPKDDTKEDQPEEPEE